MATPGLSHARGDSSWARQAREVITRAIEQAGRDGITDFYAVALQVSRAYPFGARKDWPYEVWLRERKKALLNWRAGRPLWAERGRGPAPRLAHTGRLAAPVLHPGARRLPGFEP